MPRFERLGSRLLAWLGLDFDFSLDLASQPFHAIRPELVLGARPRPEQVETLHALGITHVVSCLPEGDEASVGFLGAGFQTLFLPVHDGVHVDIGEVFAPFFAFVDAAGDEARVLVHCEVGVSRSATLVTAQVMRAEGLRFYEAFHAVRERRPQVLPNIGFASRLQAHEHALFAEPRDGYASLTRYLHEVCNVPVEIDVLQGMLEAHKYDALRAIRAIFGEEVPRVVQGVRR